MKTIELQLSLERVVEGVEQLLEADGDAILVRLLPAHKPPFYKDYTGTSGARYRIYFRLLPHSRYSISSRNSLDLVRTEQITLVEACGGCRLSIPYLDGSTLPIPIEKVINYNDIIRIKGKGLQRGKERGDLVVRFVVKMPNKLVEKEKLIGIFDSYY
jgi:hypothetical protein